jgi:3-phosphoglycerate kinase
MNIPKLTPEVVKNKVVIIRVDFNVPLTKDGKISEKTRIIESIPTLEFLIKNKAKEIHILSHLGRPKGKNDPKLSLEVVTPILAKLLGQPVEFRKNFTASKNKIQLHENVRFDKGEKNNDPKFIQKLLKLEGDIFINDGFAVSHRNHASVVGLASYLPAYPGFLLQKEIDNLSPFLQKGKIKGLAVIVGGAKIGTKINVLRHFTKTADNVLIGGALANTFLAAQGFNVGKSFYEQDELDTAREILESAEINKTGIHLPIDCVCGNAMDTTESVNIPREDIIGDMKIFDIGNHTIKSYSEVLQHAKTIIWNGPMGCFEYEPFAIGTLKILKVVAEQKSAKTILGGGDTLKAIKKFGVEKNAFSHVSTGGGAMLEFLEGKELPGISSLQTSKEI